MAELDSEFDLIINNYFSMIRRLQIKVEKNKDFLTLHFDCKIESKCRSKI